jgi:hypothetical protein
VLSVGQGRLLLGSVLLGCGLASAGCAGTVRAPSGHPVAVTLTEYRIRPARLSVPAGTITFSVHDDGRLSHDLVITSSDGTVQAHSGGLAPGHGATVRVKLDPGVYEMTSNVGVDSSVGQTGTLTVTSK